MHQAHADAPNARRMRCHTVKYKKHTQIGMNKPFDFKTEIAHPAIKNRGNILHILAWMETRQYTETLAEMMYICHRHDRVNGLMLDRS